MFVGISRLSFQLTQPDPQMVEARLALARKRSAYDLRVQMSWLEAAVPLVTAKSMAQRAIEEVAVLGLIAELFGEPELSQRSRLLLAAVGAELKRFNLNSWVKMDLSVSTVATAIKRVEELLPRLSGLRDGRSIITIHQDAKELYMRVAVNSQIAASAKKGLFAFMRPKTEMRQDLARLLESLKAAELEVLRAAQGLAADDAHKN